MRELPDHGLMFDGHDTRRADLVEQARTHLEAHGVHHLDIDEALERPGLVARAWWGGDDIGFVQEGHPNAKPVTVVKAVPPKQATA